LPSRAGRGRQGGELFSLLNPINHASTRADVQRYKVEPYAVAADVYSVRRTSGAAAGPGTPARRAGCIARASNQILGFRLQGEFLLLDPCIPKAWPGFEIVYKHRSARYEIAVENPRGVSRGVARATLDGKTLPGGPARVPVVDDGETHNVRVTLG
jgi:cyclic beta-1,2-glucan synthetase